MVQGYSVRLGIERPSLKSLVYHEIPWVTLDQPLFPHLYRITGLL